MGEKNRIRQKVVNVLSEYADFRAWLCKALLAVGLSALGGEPRSGLGKNIFGDFSESFVVPVPLSHKVH
jgi:hypothetical protein